MDIAAHTCEWSEPWQERRRALLPPTQENGDRGIFSKPHPGAARQGRLEGVMAERREKQQNHSTGSACVQTLPDGLVHFRVQFGRCRIWGTEVAWPGLHSMWPLWEDRPQGKEALEEMTMRPMRKGVALSRQRLAVYPPWARQWGPETRQIP